MSKSIFINTGGVILKIPLSDETFILRNLINNSNCPLYNSEQDAISAGDAYKSRYRISSNDRNNLMKDAGEDLYQWSIIFFLDSVASK